MESQRVMTCQGCVGKFPDDTLESVSVFGLSMLLCESCRHVLPFAQRILAEVHVQMASAAMRRLPELLTAAAQGDQSNPTMRGLGGLLEVIGRGVGFPVGAAAGDELSPRDQADEE